MTKQAFTSGPRAAFRYSRKHEDLVARAQRTHDAIAAEPRISKPNPDMQAFQRHVDAYATATADAKAKRPDAVTTRTACRAKLMEDLHHLRDAVQAVVETIANPADAAAFIEAMGFKVRRRGVITKLPLRATHGGLSGTVLLKAKAVAEVATYYWQYSLDQETWVDAGDTLTASTLVRGLTPGQTYYFRFRARARTRAIDFCQAFALIVH